jgi:hypothetical protein
MAPLDLLDVVGALSSDDKPDRTPAMAPAAPSLALRGATCSDGSASPQTAVAPPPRGGSQYQLEQLGRGCFSGRTFHPLLYQAAGLAAWLLARGTTFTALLAQSDLIALGAMRQLLESGRPVPGDVSMVGYDDRPVADFRPIIRFLEQIAWAPQPRVACVVGRGRHRRGSWAVAQLVENRRADQPPSTSSARWAPA